MTFGPRSNRRTCPIPGCSTPHARELLMCKPHWFKVPKHLRDEVWDAYKSDGVLSERYRQSRDAAIASVS